MESVSEPSVSTSVASTGRLTVDWPPMPWAIVTIVVLPEITGASTVGVTTTTSGLCVVAVAPVASVAVAETFSEMLPEKLAGGVSVRLFSAQPVTLTLVEPAAAVKLFVPSLRIAPAGMLPMLTLSVSEPSVSFRLAVMLPRRIAVSSLPTLWTAGK